MRNPKREIFIESLLFSSAPYLLLTNMRNEVVEEFRQWTLTLARQAPDGIPLASQHLSRSVLKRGSVPRHPLYTPSPTFSSLTSSRMFSKALRAGRLSTLRHKVYVPLARRTVTTDAASSHAEREHVPEVCQLASLQPDAARSPMSIDTDML